jgi:hypothetical protein
MARTLSQERDDTMETDVQLPSGRILELYRSGESWWNIANILSKEPGAPSRSCVNAYVHAVITGSQYSHVAWMRFVEKLWVE